MPKRAQPTMVLKDALPDDGKPAPDINLKLEWRGDTGVAVLEPKGREYRVLIENKHGRLMCHVWATIESLGDGEPSHSIEIELEKGEV